MKSVSFLIMKDIQCPLWGIIQISDIAQKIIDTFPFQRLHYIKQTGLAYKVFPSAVCTRFEHSIGVYHTTRLFLNHLIQGSITLPERTQELLCIVGLVHDLGHGPFSHLFDQLHLHDMCHEERSIALFQKIVTDHAIPLTNDEVQFISNRIYKPPNDQWYDTLVCNPYSSFDTDKFDYIFRDAMHFGLSVGINPNRILHNMKIIQNKLCFCERIQDEIFSFFQVREKLHRSIYRHPTIEKFQQTLIQLLQKHVQPISSLEEFLHYNDMFLLQHLNIDEWKRFEERKDLIPQTETKYHDDQKKIAFQNLQFYQKKNPTNSFALPF